MGDLLDRLASTCISVRPVSITAEFQVDPTRRNECVELMRDARLIFLRNGAYRWHLYEDMKQPNKFRMQVVVVPSWKQQLLQGERMTKNQKDILLCAAPKRGVDQCELAVRLMLILRASEVVNLQFFLRL